MIHTWLVLVALGLAQDPKTPPRTVEDRLKELEEKLGALEQRQQALVAENGTLEKRIAEGKALRDNAARLAAAGWVKRYRAAAGFSERQAAELEELWFGWSREDFEKRPDGARIKAREALLREKLSPEQASLVARKLREEQEQSARVSVAALVQMARMSADSAPALEKWVVDHLSLEEGILIGNPNVWGRVVSTVETGLPELGKTLPQEELGRLRESLSRWKPERK